MRTVLCLGFAIAVTGLSLGCGNSDEQYQPAPVWSGRKPSLPAPPEKLNLPPIKVGEAFTVAGAAHQLRSRLHEKDVTKTSITIQGYIVAENITDAPSCAIVRVGKKEADDCVAEIPSFYIADERDAGADKPRIRVLGWANNFAAVHDAMERYRALKEVKDPTKDLVKDKLWDVAVPFPLPAVGAKVKVTGKYGFTFTKASTGIVSDPTNGVMTYEKMETLEPAPQKVSFKNPPAR
ncbi:MAG: hypothetical protein FWD69_06000 [Polyangiaceae bacterium]|nr:hypothetical protein [Polyangiaceae bacterium]